MKLIFKYIRQINTFCIKKGNVSKQTPDYWFFDFLVLFGLGLLIIWRAISLAEMHTLNLIMISLKFRYLPAKAFWEFVSSHWQRLSTLLILKTNLTPNILKLRIWNSWCSRGRSRHLDSQQGQSNLVKQFQRLVWILSRLTFICFVCTNQLLPLCIWDNMMVQCWLGNCQQWDTCLLHWESIPIPNTSWHRQGQVTFQTAPCKWNGPLCCRLLGCWDWVFLWLDWVCWYCG